MKQPITAIFVLIHVLSSSIAGSQASSTEEVSKLPSSWNTETFLNQAKDKYPVIAQFKAKLFDELKITPDGLIWEEETGPESSIELIIEACKMNKTTAAAFREEVSELQLAERMRQLSINGRSFYRAKRHSSTSSTSSSSSSLSSSPSTSPRTPSVTTPNQSPRTAEKKQSDVEMQKQDAQNSQAH